MLKICFLFLLSLLLCRFFAGFDSRHQSGRYIVIHNPKLRALLIDTTSFYHRGRRLKKDIDKMTLSGLIFYIYGFLMLIISGILYISLPKTPIEHWEVIICAYTLNEKLSAIFVLIFFISVIFYLTVSLIRSVKSIEQKWIKILTYTLSLCMIAAVIFVFFDLIKDFILSLSFIL